MPSEDAAYRRLEDQKWRESVSTRLVSLTDSEVTQNDRLDDVEEGIHAIDRLLEGDPSDKHDTGLKGDLHHLETRHNELRAILAPDALGHGGFINRLKACEDAIGIGERRSENRWKFATGVVGGTIAAMTAIIVALLAIQPVRESVGRFIEARFGSPEKVEPKAAKRVKVKRRGRASVPIPAEDIPAPEPIGAVD